MKKIVATGGVVLIAIAALWYISSIKTKTSVDQIVQDGHTIVITEDGLIPDTLTVSLGTTVRFVNNDEYWHWPASDPHPSHTFYPELDPKAPIKPGATWEFIASKSGTWGIHDHLAPYITETMTVTQ